ncbi:hypothetical protein ACTACV_27585 [Pseudomonas syringae]|uniref:hypothetical protein n=1 Tax=Pseudomonas syringae TaxID=317 RepID=UPI003F7518DE
MRLINAGFKNGWSNQSGVGSSWGRNEHVEAVLYLFIGLLWYHVVQGVIMAGEGNAGVAYLIECAERAALDRERTAIYSALAEAGGEAVQDYLVQLAWYEKSQTKKVPLIKLIGRASRH